jgi:hypothetical protein
LLLRVALTEAGGYCQSEYDDLGLKIGHSRTPASYITTPAAGRDCSIVVTRAIAPIDLCGRFECYRDFMVNLIWLLCFCQIPSSGYLNPANPVQVSDILEGGKQQLLSRALLRYI